MAEPILYLAPWVDYGGTDSGTVDWFRWLDPSRYRASLITTQTSPNRRLGEVFPHASEVWPLPDLMPGPEFPRFILDFIHTRRIRVVHVMNSRLGFDMLPDIAALPTPPAIVAQLHVEEPDSRGYVRYSSTRYGNVIDAFSVVGHHLAEALVQKYEVPRSKCHVIPLGVDARTFDPETVQPAPLENGVVNILFAGRLSEQKDPMLMLDVAEGLHRDGARFRIHCLGDGPLRDQLQSAVKARGLEDHVRLHGFVRDLAPWYRAADVVLMTSVFEGVPCVAYEAMSMGVPLVAPSLPGLRELVDSAGLLVEPRDSAPAYVAALKPLLADPTRRSELGAAGRSRARSTYSAEASAASHMALYDGLIRPLPSRAATTKAPPAIKLARPRPREPLVTIIVACHNHGRWLPDCLDSIRAQTYRRLEVIIVDDASDDPDTVTLLDEMSGSEYRVVRLQARGGPSHARNVALAYATGDQVLPVDADNTLVPDALASMVAQLASAPANVGFIYPNQQYFGNRDDYSIAPDFNLYNLMQRNFCDTSSLIERAVFDAGVRYVEDIELIHEDWDLALQMAARGVLGAPVPGKTLNVRKWGYTRSDQVDHREEERARLVRARHPYLYGDEATVKARWSPALSIIPLGPLPDQVVLRAKMAPQLEHQSCVDAEYVVPGEGWPAHGGVSVRNSDAVAGGSHVPAALAAARGRFVMLVEGTGADLLCDPAFVEKVVRMFILQPFTGAIALQACADEESYPFRGAPAEEPRAPAPAAVAWSVHWTEPLSPAVLSSTEPLVDICAVLAPSVPIQWRYFPVSPSAPRTDALQFEIPFAPTPGGAATWKELEIRRQHRPLWPAAPDSVAARWSGLRVWTPPRTSPLCRHVGAGGTRMMTQSLTPPAGFLFDHALGAVNLFHLPGTIQLLLSGGGLRVSESTVNPEAGEVSLGYIEDPRSPLPMLDSLFLALDRATGEATLVAGDDDPLLDAVEIIGCLGLVEPFPIRPRPVATADPDGQHVYAVTELRRLAQARQEEVDALRDRLALIEKSIPGRAFRKVSRVPGLKRALLGRRHNGA